MKEKMKRQKGRRRRLIELEWKMKKGLERLVNSRRGHGKFFFEYFFSLSEYLFKISFTMILDLFSISYHFCLPYWMSIALIVLQIFIFLDFSFFIT